MLAAVYHQNVSWLLKHERVLFFKEEVSEILDEINKCEETSLHAHNIFQ